MKMLIMNFGRELGVVFGVKKSLNIKKLLQGLEIFFNIGFEFLNNLKLIYVSKID